VDLILDARGGEDTARGYWVLAPAGHLACFGFANLITGEKRKWPHVLWQLAKVRRWSALRLMSDNRTDSGVNLGHLFGEVALLSEAMHALFALFREGRISPRVDRVFPLSEGAAAHRFLQERRNVGKVLLDCS